MQKIELAEAIGQLREQIELAMKAAEGETLQFDLGSVELELKFELAQKTSGGKRLKAWVIEAGSEDSRNANSVHAMKMVLHPRRKGGEGKDEKVLVGSRPDFNPLTGE